jgi:hypothetical protein
MLYSLIVGCARPTSKSRPSPQLVVARLSSANFEFRCRRVASGPSADGAETVEYTITNVGKYPLFILNKLHLSWELHESNASGKEVTYAFGGTPWEPPPNPPRFVLLETLGHRVDAAALSGNFRLDQAGKERAASAYLDVYADIVALTDPLCPSEAIELVWHGPLDEPER